MSSNVMQLGIYLLFLCLGFSFALRDLKTNLSCYQCRVPDESLCTDDYIQPCPEDQAYDRCLTMENKGAAGILITKKCALGPCNLMSKGANQVLGLDHCDRNQDKYSCVLCCKENACNGKPINSAVKTVSRYSSVLTIAGLTISVFYLIVCSSLDN